MQGEQLGDQQTVAVLIAGAMIGALSLFFSLVFVRPLKKVAHAIDESSQDSVGGDIQVNDYTETILIAQAYNRMLARLRALDESRQQFVSNVSHELKTPITSIRVLADSLIGQEEAPVELYREFMSDISAEIDRESQIIDDLLTMVRMDKANAELNVSQVNINEMMENILKRLRPLAMKRNVDLVLESFRPVLADADEMKLSLAVMNLVENAIKYNVDNGWVRVSLNADHQFFYIKVEDSGIGIPEGEWDHIKPVPALRAAPGWGWQSPRALSACTTEPSGSTVQTGEGRPLPCGFPARIADRRRKLEKKTKRALWPWSSGAGRPGAFAAFGNGLWLSEGAGECQPGRRPILYVLCEPGGNGPGKPGVRNARYRYARGGG